MISWVNTYISHGDINIIYILIIMNNAETKMLGEWLDTAYIYIHGINDNMEYVVLLCHISAVTNIQVTPDISLLLLLLFEKKYIYILYIYRSSE